MKRRTLEKCEWCNGTGRSIEWGIFQAAPYREGPCPKCGGFGYRAAKRTKGGR